MPLSCILIAALVLLAFPKGVYRPKGASALVGFNRYLAHAALAGAPGALWAWADPTLPLEGLIGLVVAGIGLSTLVLVVSFMEPRRPPRPVPAPVAPAAPAVLDPAELPPPGVSPWLWARVR